MNIFVSLSKSAGGEFEYHMVEFMWQICVCDLSEREIKTKSQVHVHAHTTKCVCVGGLHLVSKEASTGSCSFLCIV